MIEATGTRPWTHPRTPLPPPVPLGAIVTKPVTIELSARVTGDTVTVQGSAPIQMADFDIEPPSNAAVTVADDGSFEFLFSLER